jgi:hypothetical protein
MIVIYSIAGPLAGALVGALAPLTRTVLGLLCVGWLVGTAIFLFIGLADEPTSNWLTEVPKNAALLGLFMGPAGALIVRIQSNRFR